MDSLEFFLRKLRQAMTIPGMTQKRLGKALGISQSMVSRYLTFAPGEVGAPMPSFDVAMRLFDLVGADPRRTLESASISELANALKAKVAPATTPERRKLKPTGVELAELLSMLVEQSSNDISQLGVSSYVEPSGELKSRASKGRSVFETILLLARAGGTLGHHAALRAVESTGSDVPTSIHILRPLTKGEVVQDGVIVTFASRKTGQCYLGRLARTAQGRTVKSTLIWCWPLHAESPPHQWKEKDVAIQHVVVLTITVGTQLQRAPL